MTRPMSTRDGHVQKAIPVKCPTAHARALARCCCDGNGQNFSHTSAKQPDDVFEWYIVNDIEVWFCARRVTCAVRGSSVWQGITPLGPHQNCVCAR